MDVYPKQQKEKEKWLYTWNWGGDGYNLTYAYSTKEALENAKKCSPSLYPTMFNFQRVGRSNSEAVKAFWKSYPMFD
jgi:hypothetical protein